jgi:hypothetical protein
MVSSLLFIRTTHKNAQILPQKETIFQTLRYERTYVYAYRYAVRIRTPRHLPHRGQSPPPLPRATPRPRPSSSSSPSLASTSFQTLELDSPLKTLTLGTPRLPPSVYPSAPRRPLRLPRPALQLGPRGPRVSPGLELLVRSLRWAGGCGQVAWWAGGRGRRRWMEMR